MEIEILIDHIKDARIKGFRDDFIKKGLLDKGLPENVIDNAFSNSGNPKRAELRTRVRKEDNSKDNSKTYETVTIDPWLKYDLEREAEKNGLSVRSEMKKILVENTPSDNIDMKVKRKTIIYKKRTGEREKVHNENNKKYKERVKEERKKLESANMKQEKKEQKNAKRDERKAKRKGLFGDWKEEVKRDE